MIRPNPGQRYPSLDQAIMAIDRNLYVEVARESFARILDDKNNESKFFRQFYYKLIEDEDIDTIFERKDLRKKQLADPSDANWQKQFDKLKEAIIFLFAFSLLQETGKRTILSPIAQSHQKMGVESDYYDSFQDAARSIRW